VSGTPLTKKGAIEEWRQIYAHHLCYHILNPFILTTNNGEDQFMPETSLGGSGSQVKACPGPAAIQGLFRRIAALSPCREAAVKLQLTYWILFGSEPSRCFGKLPPIVEQEKMDTEGEYCTNLSSPYHIREPYRGISFGGGLGFVPGACSPGWALSRRVC